MTLWHRHHWAETSRQFNPPSRREFEAPAGSIDPAEVLYGVTVVELRCEDCGDVKAVRYAGASGPPVTSQRPAPLPANRDRGLPGRKAPWVDG